MDGLEFEREARKDPGIRALLEEVAADLDGRMSVAPQKYLTVTGVDVMLTVAAYALFRLAKDFFDRRRLRSEAEVLLLQAQVIAALKEDGFASDQAQAIVESLLARIEKRGADDPALNSALALLGKKA